MHSSDEHLKEENLKSDEQLSLSKTSDETDRQEQKTATQGTNYHSEDSTRRETKDDKLGSGSEASQRLKDNEVETKAKSPQSKKMKTKLKKGRGKRKITEHEEMDEWADEDDYGVVDDDDEPYDEEMDEDLDDDEPLEGSEDSDDFAGGKDYNEEETDSIESWQMTEKPLDESDDFGDEDDRKIKEQEELQEEIKQLKGKWCI